jgi:hypothetical protein
MATAMVSSAVRAPRSRCSDKRESASAMSVETATPLSVQALTQPTKALQGPRRRLRAGKNAVAASRAQVTP